VTQSGTGYASAATADSKAIVGTAYRRAETEAEQVAAQQQEIESLKQQLQLQNDAVQERLSRLEKLLGNQAQPLAQQ
jgi:hypothetical protein